MIRKLPNNWEIQSLNDVIVDIIDYRGKTPKKLGGDWSKSGIIALSAMNVKEGKLVRLEKAKFVSDELYRKWMKSEVMKGDILMTSEAPLGETYFVADKKKLCLSQRLFCIRANPEVIEPRFLFYVFNSPFNRKQIDLKATGTTVLGIRQPDLRKIPIIVPPLPTQRKIASILSAYDDLIENNTRRIKILEDMAATIYRQWFVEFRFPGHENVPMVESELGLIPQGWEVGRLGDLCSVVPGYAFKSKDWQDKGVAVVKIKNIKSDNTIDTQNVNCVSPEILLPKLDKYRLENADFLIAMTGATAGKIGRLRTKTIMMLNQRVAKLNPIDGYRDYIWCKISLEETQNAFFRLADGAAQPNMSGSQIANYKTIHPSLSICNNFSSVVREMLIQTDNLILRNSNLRQTRDLLLPKLISGELDASELDIDSD